MNYKSKTEDQINEINRKRYQTTEERYGVKFPGQLPHVRKINRIRMSKYVQHCVSEGLFLGPVVGKQEPEFFEFIQSIIHYQIIRPRKSICGFFPDGYIQELGLVIEFDESWHKQKYYQKRDKIKNESYVSEGLKVFSVDQEIWNDDKDAVKKQFLSFIKSIEEGF